MNEHSIHVARREDARQGDGTFGAQTHSAPETALAEPPEYRSDRAQTLDDAISKQKAVLTELMEQRRWEHLNDLARNMPADATRVVFRAEMDTEGEPEMLMFDHVDTERDFASLDSALQSYLYGVALDFGTPGDFVADEWMDSDDEFYFVDVDEETALYHAESLRTEMDLAQREGGLAPLRLVNGFNAWVERATRTRAHQAGISRIHLRQAEERAGIEVVWFEHADGHVHRPDETANDHHFIRAQIQRLPHRSEGMKPGTNPDAPLILEV